ncbi:mitochondrial transcription rescue factor 1 [Rhynchophorus ferrugineus]|uniref:mitochondrial transcription rescue factor 1 n=1 Tax=Rhynchophorus ferrugineus TaxID=354439 RepID=UPI003FCDDB2A
MIQLKRPLSLPCGSLTRKPPNSLVEQVRFRYSKTKVTKSESESEEHQDDEDDEFQDKHTKILNINVSSLRVDGILKSSLGISRAKIEKMFYDSKIRINGKKLLKKSTSIHEGDEIDIVKGPDVRNPNFITVARVEILTLKAKEESIAVKIRRCKSLSIEAYD